MSSRWIVVALALLALLAAAVLALKPATTNADLVFPTRTAKVDCSGPLPSAFKSSVPPKGVNNAVRRLNATNTARKAAACKDRTARRLGLATIATGIAALLALIAALIPRWPVLRPLAPLDDEEEGDAPGSVRAGDETEIVPRTTEEEERRT